MESMSVGTPVVVCPGFGDQISNGAKAKKQGWGLSVQRPSLAITPVEGSVAAAPPTAVTSVYQATVQSALHEVTTAVVGGVNMYAEKAREIAVSMADAEGVAGGVRRLCAEAARGSV
jgi:hypothetical protein